MTKNTRFSPEVRQQAVRIVLESQGEYDSQWAAVCSIAPKIGCTPPETLRIWGRQHERDTENGDVSMPRCLTILGMRTISWTLRR
ncbi:putative transposase family protein [Escherichia coli]|nr:putative transposase family protein [Escherichia coli]CAD6109722.1 putative transposase family protein [Escherichia coli]